MILDKLKNKQDFNSAIVETTTAQIYLKLNKIYFETVKKYNITIDYHNGERITKHNQNAEQIKEILQNFNIIKISQ